MDGLIYLPDILKPANFLFSENCECLGGIWLLLADIFKLQSEYKDIFNLTGLICHYLKLMNSYLLGENLPEFVNLFGHPDTRLKSQLNKH